MLAVVILSFLLQSLMRMVLFNGIGHKTLQGRVIYLMGLELTQIIILLLLGMPLLPAIINSMWFNSLQLEVFFGIGHIILEVKQIGDLISRWILLTMYILQGVVTLL